MSHPLRLRDLIKAATDAGMTYDEIAAKTATSARGKVSSSQVHKLATAGSRDGKVPMTGPQLKALASAINQPWTLVRQVVLAEAELDEVAAYDGASVVVERAHEVLTPAEMPVWEGMAQDLIELVRKARREASSEGNGA